MSEALDMSATKMAMEKYEKLADFWYEGGHPHEDRSTAMQESCEDLKHIFYVDVKKRHSERYCNEASLDFIRAYIKQEKKMARIDKRKEQEKIVHRAFTEGKRPPGDIRDSIVEEWGRYWVWDGRKKEWVVL